MGHGHVENQGWRRVVPSPIPRKIVQLPTIRRLLDRGVTVVCCGGGGIPVVRADDGTIDGIEAVVDKDRVSALLGAALGADKLFSRLERMPSIEDFASKNRQRIACSPSRRSSRWRTRVSFHPAPWAQGGAAVNFLACGEEPPWCAHLRSLSMLFGVRPEPRSSRIDRVLRPPRSAFRSGDHGPCAAYAHRNLID